MLIFFIITTILLAIALLVVVQKHNHEDDRFQDIETVSEFWFDKWQAEVEEVVELTNRIETLRSEYTASEEGCREIEENYQQELLDEYDKVEGLTKKIEVYRPVVRDHMRTCLPTIDGLKTMKFWGSDPDVVFGYQIDMSPIYDSVIRDLALPRLF